jgi:NAD(P)-dependent dehydrogenase (short-subunit alcohol dehydrogenase family)
MPFEQKVAVITGALRGIGASLVERFRKIGYGVVANSRSIDAAGDPAVLVVDGDIAGRDTAERVVNVERFGRIDTLINNAGVFIPKQFIDYSETDFATIIAVNLGGLPPLAEGSNLDASGGFRPHRQCHAAGCG